MTEAELKDRLMNFAIRIIKMVDSMPHSISSAAIAKQVVRSGTSPIANYRAACLGKSKRDFLNKLKMEQECGSTLSWKQKCSHVNASAHYMPKVKNS